MAKRKIFTYTDVSEDVSIQKLSVKDQLYLAIKKLSKDDAEELKADMIETEEELTLRADLLEFFHKATERIRRGEAYSVTMQISSQFKPVLSSILESPSIAPYYEAQVVEPNMDFGVLVDYFIEVTLTVKR